MRISDWSSDVCSSDLVAEPRLEARNGRRRPQELCSDLGRIKRILVRAPCRITGKSVGVSLFHADAECELSGYDRTAQRGGAPRLIGVRYHGAKIGRASCRARVCQYV